MEPVKPKINIRDSETIKCDKCDSIYFREVTYLNLSDIASFLFNRFFDKECKYFFKNLFSFIFVCPSAIFIASITKKVFFFWRISPPLFFPVILSFIKDDLPMESSLNPNMVVETLAIVFVN